MSADLRNKLHLREKARRRRRDELKMSPVHLNGGRRQNVRHTKGHGRGRPDNFSMSQHLKEH